MTKTSALAKMTEQDLQIELKRELFNAGQLRFSRKAGQESAKHKLDNSKKKIARIKTLLTKIKNTK